MSRALISALLFATLAVVFAYPVVVLPASSSLYSTSTASEAPSIEGANGMLPGVHDKQGACNCSQDVELIGGITVSGGHVAATFRNPSETCSHLVGIASYRKPNEIAEDQELFEFEQRTLYPGETATLSVSLPPCAAQSDAFCGEVIHTFRGGVLYGDRLLDDVHTGGPYCANRTPTDTPLPAYTPTSANKATRTPIVTIPPTQTPFSSPSATRVNDTRGEVGPHPTFTPTPVPPVPTVAPPDRPPQLGAGDVLFGQITGLISLAGAAILMGVRLKRKRRKGEVSLT